MALTPDMKIDCIGLFCPVPILKTREVMKQVKVGQILEMISDDPASDADVRSWSARTGHHLLEVEKHGAVYRFFIRKTA